MEHKQVHETDTYKMVLNATSDTIQRVLRNNRWLLRKHGKTLTKQRNEFKAMGIIISPTHAYQLLHGNRKTCNMIYLCFYAVYWGINLADLMCRDYDKEDKMVIELKQKEAKND